MADLDQSAQSPGAGRGAIWLQLVVIAAVVAGTGAALRHWWLPPVASTEGVRIDRLFTAIFAVTATVFVLVQAALAIFALRFSGRTRTGASHWHDNPRLEIGWTAVTAAILTTFTVAGGITWVRMHQAPPPDALTVEVVAEQFGWRYRYPGPDGVFGRTDPHLINARNPLGIDAADPASQDDVVTQELHVVVGRPVAVRIRSKDVIHSFFIPNLRFKQDAVPGRVVERWFTPDREGRYEVACAELCGVGHFVMASSLVVEPQGAFDAWLQAQAGATRVASR